MWSARVVSSVIRSTFDGRREQAAAAARQPSRMAARRRGPAILPAALLARRTPLDLRRHGRHVRAPQHVVERAEILLQRLAQLSLRRLQPILQLLLYRHLLVRRLEVAALETVGEIAELLH